MNKIDLIPRVAKLPRASLVTFLLDRSGSMALIKAQTIEGFNAYLATLKADKEARIDFTLITFDSVSVDKVHVAMPIAKVPFLTADTFQPRAETPLIDAAVETIHAVSALLSHRKERTKVVINIQTDGMENKSRDHNWEELHGLVTKKQAHGWQFNFMGVGIEAYNQGMRMGIDRANTVAYNPNEFASTRAVFEASASNAASYLVGSSASTAYSTLQKLHAGDKFG